MLLASQLVASWLMIDVPLAWRLMVDGATGLTAPTRGLSQLMESDRSLASWLMLDVPCLTVHACMLSCVHLSPHAVCCRLSPAVCACVHLCCVLSALSHMLCTVGF